MLAWAAPPRDRQIHVEALDRALTDEIREHVPSELDELSTHTQIDNVVDVFVTSIVVSENSIEVHGEGVVEIELAYGSSGDERRGLGSRNCDSYPFEFQVVLSPDLNITEVRELRVDTSSFYE